MLKGSIMIPSQFISPNSLVRLYAVTVKKIKFAQTI